MKTWLDAAEEILRREGPGGTLHLKDMLVKIQHARLIDSRCVCFYVCMCDAIVCFVCVCLMQ